MLARILSTLSGENLPVEAKHSGAVVIIVTCAGLMLIIVGGWAVLG